MADVDDEGDVECTALDRDWGDDRPNILMHPPCACPACAPREFESDKGSWLFVSDSSQRYRVEPAQLGQTGSKLLG